MKCKSCGFENEYTEKYCFICGRALYNHLFSTDYLTNDSKTDSVGQEKNTDSSTPVHSPAPEANRSFIDQLGPIGGAVQSSNPESDGQPSGPATSVPSKLEPNHTFYLTNSTPVSSETKSETGKPETDERSGNDSAPSAPLPPAGGGPSVTGQDPDSQTVAANPSEESVGLRFSLDRFIHGNVHPAVREEDPPPKFENEVADDFDASNVSGGSIDPQDIPVVSAISKEANGVFVPDLREETVEPPADPDSNQEVPIDIHSLELSSIHSVSSLEYAVDHNKLSYSDSELTDDSPNGMTEHLDEDHQESGLQSAAQPDEEGVQSAFVENDSTMGINEIRAGEEQKGEFSDPEPVSGVYTDDITELATANEEPGFSQPAVLPEPLPEQPKMDEQPAKPVFHLNGFVISNETTFVRPLSKAAIIPSPTSAGDFGDDAADPNGTPERRETMAGATVQTDIQCKPYFGQWVSSAEAEFPAIVEETDNSVVSGEFSETHYNSDASVEAAASIEAEIDEEFLETAATGTKAPDPGKVVESEKIPEMSEDIADEPIPASPGANETVTEVPTESERSHEPAEDLALIDYSEEVSEDSREYAETFPLETDYSAASFPTEAEEIAGGTVFKEKLEETDEIVLEDLENAGYEPISQTVISESAPTLALDQEESPVNIPESIQLADDPGIESNIPDISQETETTTAVESYIPSPVEAEEPIGEMFEENLQDDLSIEISTIHHTVDGLNEPFPITDDSSAGLEVNETTPYEVVAAEEPASSSSILTEERAVEIEELKQLIPADFLHESPVPQNSTLEEISEPLPLTENGDAMPETILSAKTEVAAATGLNMEPEIVLIPEEGTIEQEYGDSDEFDDLSVTEFNWLWKRCGATFADGALLGLPLGLLSFLKADNVALVFLFVIVYWIYSTMFEASALQATPGKLLFGLIVADHNGKRLSYLQANNRFFAKILSGVLLRVITEKKQCLHDILSKTLVLGG